MNLTTCTVGGCEATFLWVAQRPRPDLCLEHGNEADRERNGWTPENSVD